jgi:hypothetical protein
MVGLITIRVVPSSPLDAATFTQYLDPAGLGPLQITAYVLSFNSPTDGQLIGTASYSSPTTPPGPPTTYDPITDPVPPPSSLPDYGATTIAQQVDLVPPGPVLGSPVLWDSAYFAFQSIATAVIQVAAVPAFENLRLIATWGAGPNAPQITIDNPFYKVAVPNGTMDPATWASLPPSLYLELPAPPKNAAGGAISLPDDGSPPPFDALLAAVMAIVSQDPGGGFTQDKLAGVTAQQALNIAYELLWAQQPDLPVPPDPIENLYTNPPNSGQLLDGTNPNKSESDRRQFEAQLQSYFAMPDAAATRMANFVFSLCAAVACEQMSLDADQVLVNLPVSGGLNTVVPIMLTGVHGLTPQVTFGTPAAYFYALAANLPTNIPADRRFGMATSAPLQSTLDSLTSAIAAQTISDAETFVTTAGTANAAQSARRMAALAIKGGSGGGTPLAPLNAFSLPTGAATPAGAILDFASTAAVSGGLVANDGVTVTGGLTVNGPGIALAAVVQAVPSATTAQINPATTAGIAAGTQIVFSPINPPQMQPLVSAWLSFPPTVVGQISSQTYSPTDDAAVFWPAAIASYPLASLNLTVAAVTVGFIIPPPFNVALGSKIVEWMASPAIGAPQTVAGLQSITTQQWTTLFQQNPTWLPGQQGDTSSRLAAFVQSLQTFFPVPTGNPKSAVDLASSADTPSGATLPFASTAGVAVGMNVTSAATANIPPGTVVTAVTPTSVTISANIVADVPFGTNIRFTPNFPSVAPGLVPLLDNPFTDWIGNCVNTYDPTFKFGDGITNPAQLAAAAATIFPGDDTAQAWVIQAVTTIDALMQIIGKMAPPPAPDGFAFAIVEALYARGFVSAADVTRLSAVDFGQALIGTIAYDLAASIYAAAEILAPATPSTATTGPFAPVNPDGTLVNCVPAPSESPLGAIAYLHEMLQVSESSTCEVPLTPASPKTLGDVLATRRGPLGQLLASTANLATSLPLIDIVNENLEFLGSNLGQAHGVVFDTAGDALAGFPLCKHEPCAEDDPERGCHEPDRIFAALPEHSTPVTLTTASGDLAPSVYEALKTDFSGCCLPYSQPLDVSRSYLKHLGSCRFEEMRSFRKCITEFVLDPVNEPAGFPSHVWRYPVRLDIAIEYLGISPEEYVLLFQGSPVQPCMPIPEGQRGLPVLAPAEPWRLYGFANADQREPWSITVLQLPEFLARACLSYCEFIDLWRSQFIVFHNGADERTSAFPECEPCCLDDLVLQFPGQERGATEAMLGQLAIFIRLWRLLKGDCCKGYTFDELRDICDILQLFQGGAINPDFIRQLAAFRMLCDQFGLPLRRRGLEPAPGAINADRTHILALWTQPPAAMWPWAVERLIECIEHRAMKRHRASRRTPEFIKLLASNLDALSQLCGFDPTSATDNWHAVPTHTVRFAEVLAKIYASDFSVGELLFLFITGEHLDGDDPFPQQSRNEALDSPLELPETPHEHSLWRLRERLLHPDVEKGCEEPIGWKQLEADLQSVFGFAPADVRALGAHFFPGVLRRSGIALTDADTHFTSPLASADTTATTWNTPPDDPFHCDEAAQQLTARIPLRDGAIIHQLTHSHDLDVAEQTAVQDLYFQPRALLARFALIFQDFTHAQARLVETPEEEERWRFFQCAFALFRARCRICADHLARHVAAATGQMHPEGEAAAMLILSQLLADENGLAGTPPPSWEDDGGGHGPVVWGPQPAGGGFAGLLSLVGTGLAAEYRTIGGPVVWRDMSGPLSAFGERRNEANCPVLTVLPAMNAPTAPGQIRFASAHNGFLMKDSTTDWLGGAEGFEVAWSGALLVHREGLHEFAAGAPTPDGERPDFDRLHHEHWRVTLRRGQRSWTILAHHWTGEEPRRETSLALKRGAYDILIELRRPTPAFEADELTHRQHAGFQFKYAGPDTDGLWITAPHDRLFSISKDAPLGDGINLLSPGAGAYLSQLYVGSLRDARRTYERAFKALLFAHRFALSAQIHDDGTSELGYMLKQNTRFAGLSFYRSGVGFVRHAADLDFNHLPVDDNYHPPLADARAAPSVKRTQAMFDWWERMFDYCGLRAEVRHDSGRHVWRLFDEAYDKLPADPSNLLRHMAIDMRRWAVDLRYFQGRYVPVYRVSAADLQDERWATRAWRADLWLRAMLHAFSVHDITTARPDLWASDDPGSLASGETQTGNANLIAFSCDGAFGDGPPRRYDEIRRLNDGIRLRGRAALADYLCHLNRVALPWLGSGFAVTPRDLSDLLLLDVEAAPDERASRIEEAISAAQAFIRRARLGLEPGWIISPAFALMWDREFASLRIWQACKRRKLYKENWIEWSELEEARRVEAFGFLETRLKSAELTAPRPGSLAWWPNEPLPIHRMLELLQKREASTIETLPIPREGLSLLGTPAADARPSWLSPVGGGSGQVIGRGGAAASPPAADASIPLWMQAAIRLGVKFIRIAAAGLPPASAGFVPHKDADKDCVSCCDTCGCDHPAHVDEYYFWLIPGAYFDNPKLPPAFTPVEPNDGYQFGFQDDFYDPAAQQAGYWWDATQLPSLLAWPSQPMVRLAWCLVHNGRFQQPRRSGGAVAVTPGAVDLSFIRRAGDSLYFSVANGIRPDGYADPSLPGFRFDIQPDIAISLPEAALPQPDPTFVNGLLPAYPYFAYVEPGASLFPLSPYAPAVAIAGALRSHCNFEAALKWYRQAFDPLVSDCTWMRCETDEQPPPSDGQTPDGQTPGAPVDTVPGVAFVGPQGGDRPTAVVLPPPPPTPPPAEGGACCDSTDITCAEAADRSILLLYLETLRDWGDAIMRRRDSREAFQQARVIFDAAGKLLGKRPATIELPPSVTPATVAAFTPQFPPLNPRLLDLYDVVHDRLELIRLNMNARRLREDRPFGHSAYFGVDPARLGWREADHTCAEEAEWCQLRSPYRFTFLVQKAQEYAAWTQELGATLLAAFEKGDAEYLASLHAQNERELLGLMIDAKKDQWREADWQVEALQKTKAVAQTNLSYFTTLIQNGPIGDEIGYEVTVGVSTGLRAASNIIEASGEAANGVGNYFDGIAGFGGSPLSYWQLPIGQPLGSAFAGAARIMNSLADAAASVSGLLLTQAGWQRRNDDWVHQTQTLAIDIQQIERQILGAQRRRDQMLVELNAHQRQIEQAAEVQDFLRDKFSTHDLYLHLQRETAALYYQAYDLALHACRQAERAFNIERGHTSRRFIPSCTWDSAYDGLLAGEQLSVAVRRMEKAYFDANERKYELIKHISLRLQTPLAFLRLKLTGECEIEIPEWMFDMDFPGHYMREICSVSMTSPCVIGPFTSLNCTLTLLDSMTRVSPVLAGEVRGCCCKTRPCCCGAEDGAPGYALQADDPRAVRIFGARDAIATSSGQNDSGMFELSFNDPRYLPFEYMGAVSRWRIELPPENNYFDLNSLTDTVLHINYTAREGGEALRRAARTATRRKAPGDGWALFDARHDFPTAWQLFRRSERRDDDGGRLSVWLRRDLFPFLPGNPAILVNKVVLVFETEEQRDRTCPEQGACPCPERHIRASYRIGSEVRGEDRGHCDKFFTCTSDIDCDGLYKGVLDVDFGRFERDPCERELELEFPAGTGEILRVYLLCHYEIVDERSSDATAVPDRFQRRGEQTGHRPNPKG